MNKEQTAIVSEIANTIRSHQKMTTTLIELMNQASKLGLKAIDVVTELVRLKVYKNMNTGKACLSRALRVYKNGKAGKPTEVDLWDKLANIIAKIREEEESSLEDIVKQVSLYFKTEAK